MATTESSCTADFAPLVGGSFTAAFWLKVANYFSFSIFEEVRCCL